MIKWDVNLEETVIEPGTSHIRNKRSTIELYPCV